MFNFPKKISFFAAGLILTLAFSPFAFAKKKEKDKDQPVVVPAKPVEDIEKIQTDLKQIIERTQQLQTQIRDDRNEIQQILERAKIHQRILTSITIPQPIQSKQQINQNDILAREKMRLIAQQVHQTQEQLKVVQNSKLVSSAPKNESSQAP